eukprot:scaffold8359_cov53-Attheya_sp.AAC.4
MNILNSALRRIILTRVKKTTLILRCPTVLHFVITGAGKRGIDFRTPRPTDRSGTQMARTPDD